jgi:hypothetical protein
MWMRAMALADCGRAVADAEIASIYTPHRAGGLARRGPSLDVIEVNLIGPLVVGVGCKS